MSSTRGLPGNVTDLAIADRRTAGDAIETVIDFGDYLPSDGKLLMLATLFGDDIRDALGLPTLERVKRGPDLKPLEEMDLTDLDRLDKAVETLLGPYTKFMDDPELIAGLTELGEKVIIALIAAKAQDRLKEQLGEAKAS
jgi:hypothetical protein